MNKDSQPKIVIMILVFLLIFAIYLVFNETYARYLSSTSGKAIVKIAPWNIKIEGTDITTSKTFNVNDISWIPSENIANGYIAPSRKGIIKLRIDPSQTKVATRIIITKELHSLNKEIKITSINSDLINFDNKDQSYIANLSLEKIKSGIKPFITINLEWFHVDSNNEKDTEITKNESLVLPIKVRFEQII